MKSVKNLLNVRLFSFVVIMSSALLGANSAHAQAIPVSQVTAEKPSMKVNFLGGVGDKLYFEVLMQQPAHNRTFLRIRDEDGVQLYNEVITASSEVRKVVIPKNELDQVEFVFGSGKEALKKAYSINVHYNETVEIKDVTRM